MARAAKNGSPADMERTRFTLNSRAYYEAVALYEGIRLRGQRTPAASTRIPPGLTLLGYHRIHHRDVLGVSPDRFRRQLESALERGATFVPLSTAPDVLAAPVTRAYLSVTFDDGYLDNLEVALPILEDLAVPATIFIVSGIADGREAFHWYRGNPPAAIRWEDARAIAGHPLLDFQAHGTLHRRLTALDEPGARAEIFGAKEEIERALETTVTMFCYAAGIFGSREVGLVREAGYRGAVTTSPGVNLDGDDVYRLRRLMVRPSDNDRRFAVKLIGGGLADSPLVRWARGRRRLDQHGSAEPPIS